MHAFKDDKDGYYQFADDADPRMYAHLTSCALQPPPSKTTDELKRDINVQRDTQLSASFTHDGILWHCDPIFQSHVQGFVLAFLTGILPPTATVTIRSKDNTNHALTHAQVTALAAALMAHVQGIYAASWAAKDAL